MNSVEEYRNMVEMLKQALRFYADKDNYIHVRPELFSRIITDSGHQARFALEQIEKLEKQNLGLQEDYNKLIADGEELESKDVISNIELFKLLNLSNGNKDN